MYFEYDYKPCKHSLSCTGVDMSICLFDSCLIYQSQFSHYNFFFMKILSRMFKGYSSYTKL